jgi:predicted deacetylase
VSAQYLLRFDDLCPTMDRRRWERFVPLLERYGVRPILAVVPENRDPGLCVAPEDAGFWNEMRSWQGRGATIGLHGYRHLCFSEGRSLVPLHRRTEFAGLSLETQRAWIAAGLRILKSNGLEARVWVGPRHGTDRWTVEALLEAGISVISDGLGSRPVRWLGAVWVPQQLWGPAEKTDGVWTICLHANTATDVAVGELERFLERYAGRFTTVERLLGEWPVRERTVGDRWEASVALWRLRMRRLKAGIGNRE